MMLFRERLLAKLVEKSAISRELVAKVVAWRHPRRGPDPQASLAAGIKPRLLLLP